MSDYEVNIYDADRRRGGQHVGSYNLGVEVIHRPTKIKAACNTERSQHHNRRICMEMIEWALSEIRYKESKS